MTTRTLSVCASFLADVEERPGEAQEQTTEQPAILETPSAPENALSTEQVS